jgi:hypothetical protein
MHSVSRALNLPGKPDGIDGSQVEQLFAEGRIAEVADYCECDVVSTYRLWLLHELFKGAISVEEHDRSELALSDLIIARSAVEANPAALLARDNPEATRRYHSCRPPSSSCSRLTGIGLSSTGGDREPHRDKISILGPKDDGSYVVEFRTAAGKKLAIRVPTSRPQHRTPCTDV